MGQSRPANPLQSGAEIDAFLRAGSIVVSASDRAARALTAAFHSARRSEGLSAWPAPQIFDWRAFARNEFTARSLDGRLLLNSAQEQMLWAEIAARGNHPATALAESRHRIAALAMQAHELLAHYTPHYLRPAARTAWQNDAAAFGSWLSSFDETCRDGRLLSQGRVPLALIPLLESDAAVRPPLLLVGFDRILPVHRRLFDAWGAWRNADTGPSSPSPLYFEAADPQAEFAACALWCRQQLNALPESHLLIITQQGGQHRGQIERALLNHLGSDLPPLFEFSLGVPLAHVPLARSALLLLRWLSSPLAENEVDWLLSTSFIASTADESAALLRHMRQLRRFDLLRTHWPLDAFCRSGSPKTRPPELWIQRIESTRRLVAGQRSRSPLEWAELVPQLLSAAGWPGHRPLTSAEFQTAERWNQALEVSASLGFDGRRISWAEFLSALARILDETLFTPESSGAPILIAGPAESAGLTADAIWFLGVDEDSWPAAGSMHPFLPAHVQREAAMPHSSPQLDRELASSITTRVLRSAPHVTFSYARQNEKSETRASRLIARITDAPQPLPLGLVPSAASQPRAFAFDDASQIPFARGPAPGGASVLSAQSQCAFKSFAGSRLGAKGWNAAQAGLTPAQRGQLVHAVLHSVWAGPPHGIRTLHELRAMQHLNVFVSTHVGRALGDKIPANLRDRMPSRYLDLEAARLTRLVREWLEYERTRQPFEVLETEAGESISIDGLELRVRLDRVDRLIDGSLLVIDYKTGDVSPSAWDPPRPDDVQLPLYAVFALGRNEQPGGLAFAKLRVGDTEFAGRVQNARTTLIHDLSSSSGLVKSPLTSSQLSDWRVLIERLAADFLAGRAGADPREYPATCERCGLHTLCRIYDNHEQVAFIDDPEHETADE